MNHATEYACKFMHTSALEAICKVHILLYIDEISFGGFVPYSQSDSGPRVGSL